MSVDYQAVARALEALANKAPAVMGEELFDAMETRVITPAQDLAPVDLGPLRASAYVSPPKVSRGEASVTGGFGGAAAAYAEIQHENLQFEHTVGEAKYLEKPLLAFMSRFVEYIGKRLARRLL